MLTGIGFDPGSVQTDLAQLEHAHHLGDHQYLYKQTFQFRQKAFSEGGDRVRVRVCVSGDEAEGYRVVGRLLQLATGEYPGRIAVEQQRQ